MAKKKSLQQLDLFSMFAEPEKIAEQEPAIVVTDEKMEIAAIEEKQAVAAMPAIEYEPSSIQESIVPAPSNVVFNDGKINVRIKAKPVTITTPVKEPILPVGITTAPTIEGKEVFIEKVRVVQKAADPTNPLKKRGRKSFKDMDAEVGLIRVPDDETLNKKLYYSIGEVAKFFNVNSSLIRAWEIEFDILQPRKNRKGDRYFRVEDIKNLQMIYYLLRNRKFSIDGAKQYLKTNKKGADTNYKLTQSLQKFRSFLLELKANLAVH